MKQFFTVLVLLAAFNSYAQTIADFENFNLDSESYLNGSDGSQGFTSGDVFLPNAFEDIWESWTGWSISNITDASTPGFLNQYSAIPGQGVESSTNYAVTFVAGSSILKLTDEAMGNSVSGLYVTNSTYAYWSIKDGDPFAKKFGGVTGDDPDYFLLTIKKYLSGSLSSSDSVDFYLADYRFADNAEDYIIDEWAYIDLSQLGDADSLSFSLSSSDNGQFGMNTPAYFCVDNIVTLDALSPVATLQSKRLFEMYPNPTADFLLLDSPTSEKVVCRIYNMVGQLVYNNVITGLGRIDLRHLVNGAYVVEVQIGERVSSQLLIKE